MNPNLHENKKYNNNAKTLQSEDPSIIRSEKLPEFNHMLLKLSSSHSEAPSSSDNNTNLNSGIRIHNSCSVFPSPPSSLHLLPVPSQPPVHKPTGTPIDSLLHPREELLSPMTRPQTVPTQSSKKEEQLPLKKDQAKKAKKKKRNKERNAQPLKQGRDVSPGSSRISLADKEMIKINSEFVYREQTKDPYNGEVPSFYCEACSFKIGDMDGIARHTRQRKHRSLHQDKTKNILDSRLPKPDKKLIENLDEVLAQVFNSDEVLVPEDRVQRDEIRQLVEDIVKVGFKAGKSAKPDDKKSMFKEGEIQVQMYGSSLHLCGLKSSSLDLNIQYLSSKITFPAVLRYVKKKLEESSEVTDVEQMFRHKMPHIRFKDAKYGVNVNVFAGNESYVNTSRLIWLYTMIDPRVRKLSIIFRTWAKLCHLDRAHLGSLPGFAYVMMSTFSMQQNHCLPVLHESISAEDLWSIIKSLKKQHVLREIDSDLWYFSSEEKMSSTAKKKSKSNQTEISVPKKLGHLAFANYDINWTTIGFEPVSAAIDSKISCNLSTKVNETKSESIADLWLTLLRYYTFRFDIEEMEVDITKYDTSRSAHTWNKKRLLVRDPYFQKRNIARSMGGQTLTDYWKGRLKYGTYYFFHGGIKTFQSSDDKPEVENKRKTEEDEFNMFCDEFVRKAYIRKADNKINKDKKVKKSYNMEFTIESLSNGKQPKVVCSLCNEEDHYRDDCKDRIVGLKTLTLPPITDKMRKYLEQFCEITLTREALSKDDCRVRNAVREQIQSFIKTQLYDAAELSLFGSSGNGFGFKHSDLDMCLTFKGDNTGKSQEAVRVIGQTHKILRGYHHLSHVFAILTAKVPIVKFEHIATNLEGDISFYNTLALKNTEMLRMYSMIDYRCRLLGYAVKSLVKFCNIGDASRGSLSSYAYTLLVIYFLQQRSTPVLPVLQEIYDGEEQPVVDVDGWNAYYFNDLDALPERWPGMKKNTESIAELLVGFLKFYTSEFDYDEFVICIRQKEKMTVFDKEWNGKHICIEDPFLLQHNLGGGIAPRMIRYILRVLARAAVHFSTTPDHDVSQAALKSYFLNSKHLTDGDVVPNDGCCKNCGKIGHFQRDCIQKKSGDKGQRHGNETRKETLNPKCFQCNESGHYKRECPQLPRLRQNSQGESIGNSCFKCGETGHKRNMCTNNIPRQKSVQVESTNGRQRSRRQDISSPVTTPSSISPSSPSQSSGTLEAQMERKSNRGGNGGCGAPFPSQGPNSNNYNNHRQHHPDMNDARRRNNNNQHLHSNSHRAPPYLYPPQRYQEPMMMRFPPGLFLPRGSLPPFNGHQYHQPLPHRHPYQQQQQRGGGGGGGKTS